MDELLTHWEGEPIRVWRTLWGVPALEAFERIGSTNDRARELADEGAAVFTTVLAEEQVAGRGRSGAPWHSAPGAGLWMSIVLGRGEGDAPPPHLPLLVGLAVAEALEEEIPALEPLIEWPNDLMLGGRKVGGILCEASRGGVVVGIGLNVREPAGGFPEEVAARATTLEAECGGRASRSAVAGRIVRSLRRRAASLRRSLTSGELEALRLRDALLDRPVRTGLAGEGTARSMAQDGALVLERPDGTRVRVVAGSVRPAQTTGGGACSSS
jgi:BirA family biotin operon repressor/biotin-[acetyl-CoA-carboxylase] ligase